jgi:hypothetical protein
MARTLSEVLARRPVDRTVVDERKLWMLASVEASELDVIRETDARPWTNRHHPNGRPN